jgi:hypothetical protein
MGGGLLGRGSGILHVPVAVCSASVVAIRTARLPSGERVGLGFTSEARLAGVLGTGHAWILIHLEPLRAMLMPRGITQVVVDPLRCGPADCGPADAGSGLRPPSDAYRDRAAWPSPDTDPVGGRSLSGSEIHVSL